VDDFAIALGSLRMAVAGELKQTAEYAVGAVRFDFPSTPCQALLDSLPGALLPTVQGIRIDGNLQAHGHVAFDTRSLDDLELDYEVQDGCRIMDVAPSLARERFERPFSHRVYLPDGAVADETSGPGTPNWTPLDDISPYMQVAVLTTEDGAFFHHHGFNRASIRASIIADLKGQRFVRGASTITMQLAKNLFLSREKTLSRKLEEVVLTEYLEQTFSKDELMELYLNVIEFGPAVYGVTAAAEHYFGREPSQLNLAECLFLSSLLPAPLRYGAMRDNDNHEVPESWMQTLHSLMDVAHKLGRISDAELAEAKAQPVVFWNGIDRPSGRPPVPARTHLGGDSKDEGALPEPAGDDSP
jgi:membrane peptidoglycan carboxypeptidase